MNYKQVEEYILNTPKFRKEGTIEQTRKFYEFLGKPGKNSCIVHVAGTNGKGSVCAYMNAVLREAGYQVGMFTSPHLVLVRERMRMNNQLIGEEEFVEVFKKFMEEIKRYNQSMAEEFLPTFYEIFFYMAMLFFEKQKAEIIILETGLGGRLDATNVIDAPKVAVITEIGKDHMEYLGDSFEKIAVEKAGIIKKGSIVVYSANRQESAAVIERKTRELDVLCKCVEKLEKQHYSFVDKKIDFSFFSRYYGYIPIRLGTTASYQVENARLALTAIEELGLVVSRENMQVGMGTCRWEGRMEEILPNVFLDGAHNEDGIEALLASVRTDGCQGKRWLLFSAVADKEYQIMKDKLLESRLFTYIYASPLKISRGISKDELKRIFIVPDSAVRILDSAYEGLQEILSLKNENDFVYVTGSLYLAGEIKEQMVC